jgi:hypothetical protein
MQPPQGELAWRKPNPTLKVFHPFKAPSPATKEPTSRRKPLTSPAGWQTISGWRRESPKSSEKQEHINLRRLLVMLLVQVTSRHGELDGKRLSGYQYLLLTPF